MKEIGPQQQELKEQKSIAHQQRRVHSGVGRSEGTSALKHVHELEIPQVEEKVISEDKVLDFPQKEKLGFFQKYKKKIALGLAPLVIGGGVYVGSKLLDKSDVNSGINSETTVETTVNPTQPSETEDNQVVVPATNETSATQTETQTTSTPEVIKSDAPDLTSYGLNFNAETKKYETVDNRYGVEIKNAGYFAPEVYMGEEKVGGVVLDSKVVGKIIEQRLGEENESYIPIPVDPKEGQTIKVEHRDTLEMNGKELDLGFIFVTSDKPVDLVNILYGHKELLFFHISIDENKTVDPTFVTVDLFSNKIKEDDKMGNLQFSLMEGSLTDLSFDRTAVGDRPVVEFGDVLAKMEGTLFLMKQSFSPEVNWDILKIQKPNILKIDNNLVLVKGN